MGKDSASSKPSEGRGPPLPPNSTVAVDLLREGSLRKCTRELRKRACQSYKGNRRQAHGLYSCVFLDNQETNIDEVTRVPNGRQARWTVLTDRTSYASILNVTQVLVGITLDRKTARGFSCLVSVMTLWKVTLVRWPPITTRSKISAWPLLL